MAASLAPVPLSVPVPSGGRSHPKAWEQKVSVPLLHHHGPFGTRRRTPSALRLHSSVPSTRLLRAAASRRSATAISAEYNRDGGRGGDFVAGFLLGGAVFGTLAYVFAPQIRRSILNEDEYGFRKARGPIYYDNDDGLEKTRQTLNAKLRQLNAAIDNVSSRLRGRNGNGNDAPPVPVEIETDPEVEATM